MIKMGTKIRVHIKVPENRILYVTGNLSNNPGYFGRDAINLKHSSGEQMVVPEHSVLWVEEIMEVIE